MKSMLAIAVAALLAGGCVYHCTDPVVSSYQIEFVNKADRPVRIQIRREDQDFEVAAGESRTVQLYAVPIGVSPVVELHARSAGAHAVQLPAASGPVSRRQSMLFRNSADGGLACTVSDAIE
jgi:hypothetical protein